MSALRSPAEQLSAIRIAALKLCTEDDRLISNLTMTPVIQRFGPIALLHAGVRCPPDNRRDWLMPNEDIHLREQMSRLLQAVATARQESFYWSDDADKEALQALESVLRRLCDAWERRRVFSLPGGMCGSQLEIESEKALLRELTEAANSLPIRASEPADKSPPSAPPQVRRKRRGGRPVNTDPKQDRLIAEARKRWLTVTEAATIANVNRGIITRAVTGGKLKGNGKSGRERRIDNDDLARWILERSEKPVPTESEAQVRRLVNKHCRP
jgi:excisionase family DNA binding protein